MVQELFYCFLKFTNALTHWIVIFDVIFFLFILEGEISFVSKRLDGRYDWVPSPYTLKTKHPKAPIVKYGNGCELQGGNFSGKIVLMSRGNNCSFVTKVTELFCNTPRCYLRGGIIIC